MAKKDSISKEKTPAKQAKQTKNVGKETNGNGTGKKAAPATPAKKAKEPDVKLTIKEVHILRALAATKTPISRGVLEKEYGASSRILGASTKEGLGKQGGGLEGRGLIDSLRQEGERQLFYKITPEGLKALKDYKDVE